MIENVLVTGGAGFVGSNLASYWLDKGCKVTVYDNLSRPGGGAKKNIEYLKRRYASNPKFEFIQDDVSNPDGLKKAVRGKNAVFHLAAQTAMTTSIDDPMEDFNTNGRGTVNVLEAVRSSNPDAVVVYTSTNKVYGDLTRKPVKLVEKEKRWDFAETRYQRGIDESYPLDFEGPYGCSKGTGDAYCMDYARTFKLNTVIFRMSGIYGMSQHPTEDQAWVAWFVRRALQKEPVTIFGDGKQVRDILFITDLLNAFDRAAKNVAITRGQVYNIGGGRDNSISVLELLELLDNELGIKPSKVSYGPWRLADQKVYISDTRKAKKGFDWEPEVSKVEGIRKLHEWIKGLS